jgi:hypothetical protein
MPVYLMENFLKKTCTPGHGVLYEGEVRYGPRAEHCWNGDPEQPNWYSCLHYNQMYAPQIVDRIVKTAATGADLTSCDTDPNAPNKLQTSAFKPAAFAAR